MGQREAREEDQVHTGRNNEHADSDSEGGQVSTHMRSVVSDAPKAQVRSNILADCHC